MHTYRIRVTKDYLGFASGHFITYDGDQCEPLHGHNYYAAINVEGELDENAYVFNFVIIKKIMRAICDGLDHKMLMPTGNPHLTITSDDTSYTVRYKQKTYVMPREDVVQLPVPNTTSECLARWLGERLLADLGAQGHDLSGLRAVEVEVEETIGQRAFCRLDLPLT
jgi:6-pyruvoyltetrahydropterin/6-carboxytetrahydropterin synthase